MDQNGTQKREDDVLGVPDWRLFKRPYEVTYLMRLGGLNRSEAVALINRHNGDRYEINAELISRHRQRQ
jgi:hypothetical protein